MTIPKGIDYGFTITVVEKDSFLPQDLENMDLVNSSFKLCTLDTLCDVTTGTATLTRQADGAEIYTEAADTITRDYAIGDFVNQTTSGLYYECNTAVAAEKYLTDSNYFVRDLSAVYEEAGTTLTRNYLIGNIINDSVGAAWYKCLDNTNATKSLTETEYFEVTSANFEATASISLDYSINDIVKNNTSGLWYRCTSDAAAINLTDTFYFEVVTPYNETSTTTTVAYTTNDYVLDTGSGIWYRCIADSTIGELLTNVAFFSVVTLNTEANDTTTSAYVAYDLIYNQLQNSYYRCIFAAAASPLLTDVAYFATFTLNIETTNTITSDYVLNDIVYNSTSNAYFRCVLAATAAELLTDVSNFEVITVKTEATPEAGISNDYTLDDYAYDTSRNYMYQAITSFTANELLTDTDYFDSILLANTVTYLDGKIKVDLDSTLTDSLTYLRGDAVDGYYLKPTYQGVINIKFTDGTPERTAIIEKVYVAPTGVVCV
jgi:hypothetical protein